MTVKQYIVDTELYNRRLLTELQHKLRVVLKCYTVVRFILDYNTNEFTFTPVYKIGKVRMESKKTKNGRYSIEQLDNEKSKLSITIL